MNFSQTQKRPSNDDPFRDCVFYENECFNKEANIFAEYLMNRQDQSLEPYLCSLSYIIPIFRGKFKAGGCNSNIHTVEKTNYTKNQTDICAVFFRNLKLPDKNDDFKIWLYTK